MSFANFVGLSASSISKYIKSGLSWNNLYFFKLSVENDKSFVFSLENESIINDKIYKNLSEKKYKSSLNIDILDNNEVIYNFDSLRAASKYLNISRPSLVEYSKSERL